MWGNDSIGNPITFERSPRIRIKRVYLKSSNQWVRVWKGEGLGLGFDWNRQITTGLREKTFLCARIRGKMNIYK